MPIFQSKDIALYYEVHGQGRPFVFISETAAVGGVWKFHQVPEFSPDYRVIIFDYRGTGKSDKPNMKYTTRMFAEDLASLMNHLGTEQAIVCGHSMGGRVAQLLALDHSHLVKKLILASTGDAHLESKGLPLKFCAEIIRKGYERYVRERIVENGFTMATRERYPEELQRYVEFRMANLPPLECYLRHQVARQEHDTSDRLTQIQVPTLVLIGGAEHSESDEESHWSKSHLLARAIPHAKMVVLPGQGHRYFFVRPDSVHQVIRDFLNEN